MLGKYILNSAGEPERCDDVYVWGQWFDDVARRRVAETYIGDIQVSTVFLGADHNFSNVGAPVLWETMVFGGPLDNEMDRYASRQEAEAGHAAMVERVRAAGA